MYCECPICGVEIHLRLAMPIAEWLKQRHPNLNYPLETPKELCPKCWKQLMSPMTKEPIASCEECKGDEAVMCEPCKRTYFCHGCGDSFKHVYKLGLCVKCQEDKRNNKP